MGYSRFPENVGSMVNRGVEMDLYSNIIENKRFLMECKFEFYHFKNKVLELSPELNGQLIEVLGSIAKMNLCFSFIYLNMPV